MMLLSFLLNGLALLVKVLLIFKKCILQDFRNIFLKDQLRKAASAAFLQIKIKGFDLKSLF